jgi:L-asparaginase
VAPNIGVNDCAFGFIAAGDLNPQKARVLLMVGVLKTSDPQELQPLFFRH